VTDGVFLLIVTLALTGVASWTVRVQCRHDSVAVLASAVALLLSTLPLVPFAAHLIAKTSLLDQFPSVSHLTVAIAAIVSSIAGPILIAVALWTRRTESLPPSTWILQACHVLLWALLTFFGLGMTVDV
jgi:hypothetical protein